LHGESCRPPPRARVVAVVKRLEGVLERRAEFIFRH
jgi:hypothetical protein